MENETREVVYLALSLMILAVVLSFIVYGLGIVRQVSNVRNDEVQANEKIEEYREFNAYNAQTLIGDDVIELIRLKYDTGITIFVDSRSNGLVTPSKINSAVTCTYCESSGYDHRFFNLDMYNLHKSHDEQNYFKVDILHTNNNDIRNWFPTTERYRAYLAYDNEDMVVRYNKIKSTFATKSSGITDPSAKLRALDEAGIEVVSSNANVTGVILIKLSDIGINITS